MSCAYVLRLLMDISFSLPSPRFQSYLMVRDVWYLDGSTDVTISHMNFSFLYVPLSTPSVIEYSVKVWSDHMGVYRVISDKLFKKKFIY